MISQWAFEWMRMSGRYELHDLDDSDRRDQLHKNDWPDDELSGLDIKLLAEIERQPVGRFRYRCCSWPSKNIILTILSI